MPSPSHVTNRKIAEPNAPGHFFLSVFFFCYCGIVLSRFILERTCCCLFDPCWVIKIWIITDLTLSSYGLRERLRISFSLFKNFTYSMMNLLLYKTHIHFECTYLIIAWERHTEKNKSPDEANWVGGSFIYTNLILFFHHKSTTRQDPGVEPIIKNILKKGKKKKICGLCA